ncbi:MFS transporter [Paenibacillus sp. 481]|uniref:MFS transporter n=1 Tax=Paenibacillus sp. 481 TaxID=2835869 RepID=UPI001E394876|nr:MFS transporter [Paenibacillus sp. 481]
MQLFKNKVFVLVSASDLLQNIAIWIRNMALLYFIMEKTSGSTEAIALITVLEYAPIFIFSIIGGALADRWNPKRTMITGDVLSALSILIIIAVLQSGYWEVLYIATFVSAVVSQFSQPASSKLFKLYVPEKDISLAIGISQSLHSLFIMIGPLVGTFIYYNLGMTASLYCLVGLFALSFLCLSFLPAIKIEQSERISLLHDIKEGWAYVYQSSALIKMSILFCLFGLGAGLMQPLEIFLITERLGLDQKMMQYIAALTGLGMLIGGGIATVSLPKLNMKQVLIWGLLMYSVSNIISALSTELWLTAATAFADAVCMAFVNIVIGTQMINLVSAQMIGRVTGTITPLFMGSVLLGSSLSAFLKISTSLVTVYVIAACVVALATIPAYLLKLTNTVEADPQPSLGS